MVVVKGDEALLLLLYRSKNDEQRRAVMEVAISLADTLSDKSLTDRTQSDNSSDSWMTCNCCRKER